MDRKCTRCLICGTFCNIKSWCVISVIWCHTPQLTYWNLSNFRLLPQQQISTTQQISIEDPHPIRTILPEFKLHVFSSHFLDNCKLLNRSSYFCFQFESSCLLYSVNDFKSFLGVFLRLPNSKAFQKYMLIGRRAELLWFSARNSFYVFIIDEN